MMTLLAGLAPAPAPALAAGADEAIAKARALAAEGDYAGAIAGLEAAAGASPEDIAAASALAELQLDAGRHDDAAKTLARLRSLGQSPATLALASREAALRGDVAGAESALREAVAAQAKADTSAPKIARYQVKLGELLLSLGRVDDAEREFKGAIKRIDDEHLKLHELNIDHDHANYFSLEGTLGLARIQTARGDLKKAARLWKQVVLHGVGPSVLLEAADAYGRGGKAKDAESVAKKAEALMLDPKHRRDRIRIAADRLRGLEEALPLAAAELAARQDVETRDLAAWAFSQAGKGPEAIAAIEPALALGAADARLWYHAGVIFGRAGRADRSREAFERSREINPQFRPAGTEGAAGAPAAGAAND